MNMQDFWIKGQLPELMGDMCFSDGRMVIFNEKKCCKKYSYEIRKIDSYIVDGYDIEVFTPNYKVFFGGGDMGNYGYLVYTDDKNNILWYMFLDYCNPFIKVDFDVDKLIATTEIDYVFTIPLDEPEKMTSISYNPWGY